MCSCLSANWVEIVSVMSLRKSEKRSPLRTDLCGTPGIVGDSSRCAYAVCAQVEVAVQPGDEIAV